MKQNNKLYDSNKIEYLINKLQQEFFDYKIEILEIIQTLKIISFLESQV